MKIIHRFACASYDVGKLDNYMYATKKCIKNALYPDLKNKIYTRLTIRTLCNRIIYNRYSIWSNMYYT